MNRTIAIARGQRLPHLFIGPWSTEAGTLLDLTTLYTLSAVLVAKRDGEVYTVTGLITGQVGGMTIAWSAQDLDKTPGTRWYLWATATETATGKPRVFRPGLPPIILIAPDNRVVP